MTVVTLLEIYMWRSHLAVDMKIIESLVILFLFSLADDVINLSSFKQFLLHIIAAFMAVHYGNLQVNYLGPIFGHSPLVLSPVISQIFSIIALVGVINALNMLDGINGLLGSFTILLASLFLALGIFYHHDLVAFLAAILLSIFSGFMIFNFPYIKKNKHRKVIFMGDTGSSLAGFMLYWIIIEINRSQAVPFISPISMVWFLALPLMDMLRVMLKRLHFKVSLGQPDRLHFHHVLIANKWEHLPIVMLSFIMSLFFIAIGCLSFFGVPDAMLFLLFWIVFFFYKNQWNRRL